ncbi:small G protein signaling modulator 1 [Sardina pilchardus]|uniref:small G protein signaling modulator 1 n=1 Tax=Sardina pilchardus TaxID=27697 RepID=UPI002E128C90
MGETETRQRLLRSVKKEVKQIMEEAVTRKFVHEDSSHIISFCAVVEACVLHGLRRRAAGFLRSNKLAALFVKVGKVLAPAEDLCRKVQEVEQIMESKQNQARLNQDSNQKMSKLPNLSPQAIKHLWIRTALTEKVLDKIVLYLVENSSKFYEREALLRDPVDGPILASLLVGPCALEYTKAKTANHFWTDPSADELVQRHRIHSGHCRQDSPTKRPALITKRQSSGSMDDRPTFWARDYVESLHQNSRATLLFGKNNVLVQPTDDMEAIPGYLSLHQTADLMTLKWTPNQLMNGNMGDLDYEKSVYWDYAMTIRLEEIVYLHCHQQVDSGGTVVLVSQDGIQRPPLRFPRGGHLLQFLTCLENGLLPHGQLDPPLWSQRGKGKVFPKLRRRSPHGSCESVSDKEEDEATDYVFRILLPSTQSDFVAPELIDQAMSLWQPSPRKSSCSSCSQNGSSDGGLPDGCNHDRPVAPLKLLCETMKYQIISRAFYGWLAYCRHLSTVRTHLSALINPSIIEHDFPTDAKGGLSLDVWNAFLQDSSVYEELEILRLVYYGGVEPSIRKEVWPFLLGHYTFTMTSEERKEVDEQVRASYEQTMSEWLGCEAIVKQREKEQHAAALARCTSETGGERGPRHDSTVSSDSSQSSSTSERQSHASSHSDSNSSAQVFGSVDEEDQPELEAKPEDQKPVPKLSNGTLANGTSSPDSGHPSSRNFSTTSGLSDCSPSTDEASAHDSGARAGVSQTPTKKSQPEPAAEGAPVSVADSPPKAPAPESELTKPHPVEQEVKAPEKEKTEVVSEEGAAGCVSVKEDAEGVLESEPAAPVVSEKELEMLCEKMVSEEKAKEVSEEASGSDSLKEGTGILEGEPAALVASEEDNTAPAMESDSGVALEGSLLESEVPLSETDPKQQGAKGPEEKGDSEKKGESGPQETVAEAEAGKETTDTQETQDPETEEEKVLSRLEEKPDSAQESTSNPEQNEKTESSAVKTPETADKKSPEMEKTPEGTVKTPETADKKSPEMEKTPEGTVKTPETADKKSPEMEKTPEGTVKTPETADKKSPETEKATEGAVKTPETADKKSPEMEKTPDSTVKTPETADKKSPEMEKTPEGAVKTPETADKKSPEMEKTPKGTVKTPETADKKSPEMEKTPDSTVKTPETADKKSPEMEKTPEGAVKTPETADKKSPETEKTPDSTQCTEGPIPKSESLNKVHAEILSEDAADAPKDKNGNPGTDHITSTVANDPPKTEESEDHQKEDPKAVEPQISGALKPEEPAISAEAEESSPSKGISSSDAPENTGQSVNESKQAKSTPTKEVNSSVTDENAAQSVTESKQEEPSQSNKVESSETLQNAAQTESHSKEAEPSSVEGAISSDPAESIVPLGTESKPELSPTKELLSSEATRGSEAEDINAPGMEEITVSDSDHVKASQLELNWVLERRDSNTESEGCVSAPPLLTQQSSTLDMADSDDSPSALEMEDIPTALICMSTEDHWGRQPLILDAPSALRTPREPGVDLPILELRLEVGPNTSPEATESILSEEDPDMDSLFPKADSLAVRGELKNELASPVSSIGTTYSQELLDMYMLNLHRIEKDVHRCDRNYWYFTTANLEKLRNIMCSYVWQHLEIGYVQGMCDLLAPLLVILDDEAMAFSCFTELMKRMNQNFPHGGAMDSHFANMRSLIQILDSELFELMQQNGDYTHFYFCYRWFLLDFKREMVYDDVFSAWETIWAARSVSSSHFVLFIALALVEHYRDIILENNMDFTEIIKFFNEMAERHDVPQVLVKARELVHKVQTLIENK